MPRYRVAYRFGHDRTQPKRLRRLETFREIMAHLATGTVALVPGGRSEHRFESDADLDLVARSLGSCLHIEADRVYVRDEDAKEAILIGFDDETKMNEAARLERAGWKVEIR